MSDANQSARVDAAVRNLRLDAATAEVARELAHRGVDAVVLKGPALKGIYPQAAARAYSDGDLWVHPEHVGVAEEVLTDLRFVPEHDQRGLPGWWEDHASSWVRFEDAGAIDLHRKLQGVGISASAAWDLLWPDTVPMIVANAELRRLSDPARALYVVLHAAHHGPGHGGSIAHLDAALVSVPAGVWEESAQLASRLDAVDSLAAGLRLSEAGASLAEELALPMTQSVRVKLQAASAPPVALGFEQLASASGTRRRIEILVRKVFPPPGFIRQWWPPAARSTPMLWLGYVYRPIWLIQRAPAGWRSWRAARREVRNRA
jgi:hypothetical protein